MLHAKDLMIGDWVETEIMGIGKITAIDSEDSVYVDNDAYMDNMIHPIPLTPEILEKNGFIKDAYKDDRLTDTYHLLVPTGFERDSFTIQVSLYKEPICDVSTLVKCWGWLPPYNGGLNDIHLCSANYVHELQHALRLCGIEKEIKI